MSPAEAMVHVRSRMSGRSHLGTCGPDCAACRPKREALAVLEDMAKELDHDEYKSRIRARIALTEERDTWKSRAEKAEALLRGWEFVASAIEPHRREGEDYHLTVLRLRDELGESQRSKPPITREEGAAALFSTYVASPDYPWHDESKQSHAHWLRVWDRAVELLPCEQPRPDVDTVARAMYLAWDEDKNQDWSGAAEIVKEVYRREARAAIDVCCGPEPEPSDYTPPGGARHAALRKAREARRAEPSCICGDGNPESYEGPLRDCPIHGEQDSPGDSQAHNNRSAQRAQPGPSGVGRQGSDSGCANDGPTVALAHQSPAGVIPSASSDGRCDICGWPLAESIEKGCVPGNCSHRPRPAVTYREQQAAQKSASCVVCAAPRTPGAMGWQDLLCSQCFEEFQRWRSAPSKRPSLEKLWGIWERAADFGSDPVVVCEQRGLRAVLAALGIE